jgi:hypothetical protein
MAITKEKLNLWFYTSTGVEVKVVNGVLTADGSSIGVKSESVTVVSWEVETGKDFIVDGLDSATKMEELTYTYNGLAIEVTIDVFIPNLSVLDPANNLAEGAVYVDDDTKDIYTRTSEQGIEISAIQELVNQAIAKQNETKAAAKDNFERLNTGLESLQKLAGTDAVAFAEELQELQGIASEMAQFLDSNIATSLSKALIDLAGAYNANIHIPDVKTIEGAGSNAFDVNGVTTQFTNCRVVGLTAEEVKSYRVKNSRPDKLHLVTETWEDTVNGGYTLQLRLSKANVAMLDNGLYTKSPYEQLTTKDLAEEISDIVEITTLRPLATSERFSFTLVSDLNDDGASETTQIN